MPLPPTDNLTIGEVMHRLSSLTPQDFVGEVNDLRERYKKLPPFVLPLDYVGDLAQSQAGLGAGFLFDQTSPPNNGIQTPVIDCSAFSSLGLFLTCSGAGTSQFLIILTDSAGTQLTLLPLVAPAAAAGTIWLGLGPGTSLSLAAGAPLGVFPLPNFLVIQAGAAGVGNTVRLIVYGRR